VIVGGGLAGLSLLFHLQQAGVDAVLIEKDQIAAGASGRNGGFCSDGWAASDDQIARLVGTSLAEELIGLASEGRDWMAERVARESYAATAARPGILTVHLSGEAPPDALTGPALAAYVNSPRYRFGDIDTDGFQFHPLSFMSALADETIALGGRIYTQTGLTRLSRTEGRIDVETTCGTLNARRVVLATGGYGGLETGPLARHLLRIRTYIGVTLPLGPDVPIRTDLAIGDTRRAGNYYRKLPDGRLLWGHGITAFGTLDPARIKARTQADIAAIFPGFAPELDFAWGGNMAYAPPQMPIVGALAPGLFALSGFGGHGMNTAPIAARVLAEALTGTPDRLRPFNAIPRAWAMGRAGPFAVEAQYQYLRLRDWLAER
jgi:gamma-glutamylputrescine oxidase